MSVATLAVHKVTTQRKTTSVDASGGITETWANYLTLSCRIQPLSAREQQLYSRETEVVTHKIYFPGTPDITPSHRIVYGSNTFEVKGVRNIDHLDRFLTVEAELQT